MKDWKFCPRCGHALNHEGVAREFHVICPQCSFFKYENPLPTTIGIIEDRGRLLLLRRAEEPKRGEWDAVGGFLAPGESAEECLVREGLEELGCELLNLAPTGTYKSVYGNTNLQTIGIAFHCNLAPNSEIRLSGENTEFAWFEPGNLPSIAFADVQSALDDAAKLAKR